MSDSSGSISYEEKSSSENNNNNKTSENKVLVRRKRQAFDGTSRGNTGFDGTEEEEFK